jgi:ADP-ribose pyrophosphatase YjhB (NUDIX family)
MSSLKQNYTGITKEPNLGGLLIELLAKSDAEYVTLKRVEEIASGIVAMPFMHVMFLLNVYEEKYGPESELVKRLKLITKLSALRQIRLIMKINQAIENIPGMVPFEITDEIISIIREYDEIIGQSHELGVNTLIYLDESTDPDDIEQSTNKFCIQNWNNKVISNNVNEQMYDTGDSVRLITDIDGVDWVVVISRKFGPGRNQYAYAGGYVDDGETIKQATKRERDEETNENVIGVIKVNVRVNRQEYEIEPYVISYWDIRPYNAIAMENGIYPKHGAVVTWDTYTCVDENKQKKMRLGEH